MFQVPGSCSTFGFCVHGAKFEVRRSSLEPGTSNLEREREREREREHGTRNPERGTATL